MRLKVVWVIVVVGIIAVVNMYSQKEDGMKESVSLKKVERFKEARRSGSFSPDGTKLMLKNYSGFRIVEIRTGKVLCELKAPTDDFFDLEFTRDWKKFAISFITGEKSLYKVKVILGEVSTCKEIKTLYHKEKKGTMEYLSFSRDGKKVALVSGFLRIIDVESGEDKTLYEMDSFPEGYEPMSNLLSPDGKWLVIHAARSVPPYNLYKFPALYVMDLESRERRLLSKNDRIETFKFSRDSELLITYGDFVNDKSDYEGSGTRVYEVGSWKLLRTLEAGSDVFDISPDNKLLAVGHWGEENGTVSIYSLETGEKLEEKVHYKWTLWDDVRDLSRSITMIVYIEFSPDGKTLATGGGGEVKLWRIERVKEKKRKRSWWRDIFIDKK